MFSSFAPCSLLSTLNFGIWLHNTSLASSLKMAPITTYFLMLISSVFYVFSDAHLALQEFTAQDHLAFPYSSLGYSINHHEYPILL
ncbi:hypothetical protein VNO80_16334 [Phaseolus coccineus]